MMSALPPRSGESPRRGVSRLEMMQVSLTGFFFIFVLVPLLQLLHLRTSDAEQSIPFINQASLFIRRLGK